MIAGTAAGALIGLLFVAVSIRIEVIAASRELRNRAAQTLGLFVAILLVAILLSVPGQALLVLGIESGLYVLVAMVIVAMVGGITSAWLFLTKITAH